MACSSTSSLFFLVKSNHSSSLLPHGDTQFSSKYELNLVLIMNISSSSSSGISVKGESLLVADVSLGMSVKGERGELKGESDVLRAKKSLVSEDNDI